MSLDAIIWYVRGLAKSHLAWGQWQAGKLSFIRMPLRSKPPFLFHWNFIYILNHFASIFLSAFRLPIHSEHFAENLLNNRNFSQKEKSGTFHFNHIQRTPNDDFRFSIFAITANYSSSEFVSGLTLNARNRVSVMASLVNWIDITEHKVDVCRHSLITVFWIDGERVRGCDVWCNLAYNGIIHKHVWDFIVGLIFGWFLIPLYRAKIRQRTGISLI